MINDIQETNQCSQEKELCLSCDEFTMTLAVNEDGDIEKEWIKAAHVAIQDFIDRAKLLRIFGEIHQVTKNFYGHDTTFCFGAHPFAFTVSYHSQNREQKIVVHFSAYAWSQYQKKWNELYDETINVHSFLRNVQSPIYATSLTRIDLAIDYFNFHLCVDDIYKRFKNGVIDIWDSNKKRSMYSRYNAFENDGEANTIYIGSRKANTNGFLRVYNKKLEQIEKNGFNLQRAQECHEWVRLEAVFKQNYAKQLHRILLESVTTNEDLQALISEKFTERFGFYDVETEELTDFSQAVADLATSPFPALTSPSPRDNSLQTSINYLKQGSGLYATFCKIEQLWGNEALRHFISSLYEDYCTNFTQTKEIKYWLNLHHELKAEDYTDYL